MRTTFSNSTGFPIPLRPPEPHASDAPLLEIETTQAV
jgi:hypothetical protein